PRLPEMMHPEDEARANLYGLIARLFQAAPDSQLISQLLAAPRIEGEGELGASWREMIEACRTAFPAALESEHTDLFVGTGKSLVTPYLSYYLRRHGNDNPLVELRAQLGRWGIARREGVAEYEDHVSGVCETMRFVIAVQQRNPEEQQVFFERFVYPGAAAFCDALSALNQARFYRLVARFARAFFEVEKSAFEIAG
ncbi:MAG TPA: molecular chaperone TorD family protein, partial [Burkholderiales bacterium]|nr:molecular chaperone TorD family protein [Burkholderiales bacterium]